jgi:hypothetical protein
MNANEYDKEIPAMTTTESTSTMPLSADDAMQNPLKKKPLAIREAAENAGDVLCALIISGDMYPTGHALILERAAFDLTQHSEPDLVQLGYLMGMEAVLATPAEVLGQVLHTKARELRAQLAVGMPQINAFDH